MAATQLVVHSRQPYEGGTEFGASGAYERIDGVLHFTVDPANRTNEAIVDLDLAKRGADGRVHFSADFCLLQPVDPTRGRRRLLFDVANRGRRRLPAMFNFAPPDAAPSGSIDPGDGFLMRHGWTLAWCGWQWDVVRSPALVGLEAPSAVVGGRPVEGRVAVEFQTNTLVPDHLLADRIHRPYAAADVNEPEATLVVRDWRDGPWSIIPRDRWRFAREESGRVIPDDGHIWLAGGFEPGRVYQVIYRTRTCPVVGTGLLAVRDCVSFLRGADATSGNPCAGRIDHTYAFGVSQSGRFLRHFLYLGLNRDEQGQQVFDGILPHVAGARRGEFNHRYAQPSQQNTANFGHLMPFAADDQTDPLTGRSDGLLRRQRDLGGVPRIIATNSGAEYWRADGSLLHTDMAGEHDQEPPEEMRIYYFAGTQHTPGGLPLNSLSPLDGSHGVHPFNIVNYSPLLRAALVNLDRWVTEGEEPPPSVFPRIGDGTAVRPSEAIDALRKLPFTAFPMPERLKKLRRLDLGSEAEHGIGHYPAVEGDAYPSYVPAVDADGNELGGIRLPDLSVPVATYTGWNPRHPDSGGEGQIIDMLGSTLSLCPNAEDRARCGDPRASIAERYRDRDEYLTRVRAAAGQLVDQRLMLSEDIERVLRLADERYDQFCNKTEPSPARTAAP